jgi:sn-glycerol 3-phosphate transport system ATP-binding protein
VALGRAVIAEALVCPMDEPLSNLDAQLRTEMGREIPALQHRLGLTMLYVTRDQTEAVAMADQAVVLRASRIEQDASPDRLYATPETAFAGGFVGTPPMNILLLTAVPGGFGIPGWLLTDLLAATAGLLHLEYLGAETIAECRVGKARVLVCLPGRPALAAGQAVTLGFDPEDLHLFDPAGRRLVPVPQRMPAYA